jgi:hypothetical protein
MNQSRVCQGIQNPVSSTIETNNYDFNFRLTEHTEFSIFDQIFAIFDDEEQQNTTEQQTTDNNRTCYPILVIVIPVPEPTVVRLSFR